MKTAYPRRPARTRARLGFAGLAVFAVVVLGGAVAHPAGALVGGLQDTDVSLTISVGDPTPAVGDQVTFTVQLTNSGPAAVQADAGDRNLQVLLPRLAARGLTFVSGSATQGTVHHDSDGVRWNPTDAALLLGSATMTFTATVTQLAVTSQTVWGEVSTLTTTDPDSSPHNCESAQTPDLLVNLEDDCDSVAVQAHERTADISLQMSVDDATPAVGETVTLTLTVANAGDDVPADPSATPSKLLAVDIHGLRFAPSLPLALLSASESQGAVVSAGSAQRVTWFLTPTEPLPANGTATLTMTAEVTAAGPIPLWAEVANTPVPDPDSNPANCDTNQDDSPDNLEDDCEPVLLNARERTADVSLQMSVDDTTPGVGQTVTFTLTVANAGEFEVPANPFDIFERLLFIDIELEGLVFVDGSASQGAFSFATPGFTGFWIPNRTEPLPANGTATLTITARVIAAAPFQSWAEVGLTPLADPDSDTRNCDSGNDHSPDNFEDDCDSVVLQPTELGTLTVTKQVVNDDGGTASVGDFQLKVGTTSVTSGVAAELAGGTYTVSESGPPGYRATFSGDCAADGSITLAPGEVKSCTLVNDDIAPRLTVVKQVVNNSGGGASAGEFTIHVGGQSFPGSAAGTTVELDPGAYSVAETGPAGYFSTFSAECSGTIALGETKTCTIVNDDAFARPTDIGVSCKELVAGQGSPLGQMRYRTRSGGLISALDPWAFTYWTRILAPAASFTVYVVQSSTHNTLFGLAHDDQVQLYDAACVQRSDLRTVSLNAGQAALTITGATPGAFYLLSVRYNTRPLLGLPAPNPPSAHYDFETRVDGTLADRAIPGLDLVKQ